MPRVRALALVAALPIAALAACSDRPNDLYTYYDDPTSASAVTGEVAAPPPVSTSAALTETSRVRAPAELATGALMRQSDLVAEEVVADQAGAAPVTTLPDCGIDLGAGTAKQATWAYPSGARLRQVVVFSTGTADAADVVAAARSELTCKTFKVAGTTFQLDKTLTLPELPDTDDQVAWCATTQTKSSCTVVVAADRLLTAITVEAGTPARAKTAIARVAPTAAKALTRGA